MKTKRSIFLTLVLSSIVLLCTNCTNRKQTTEIKNNPDTTAMGDKPTTTIENPSTEQSTIVIDYRRTPCFGTCPIFQFTVYSNGQATYEGKNFVDLIGTYRAQASADQIASILAVANKIHFFDYNEVYDNPGVTDLPSVHVSLQGKHGLKSVKSRYQGPKELKQLTEQLDALIKTLHWQYEGEIKN